MIKEDPAEMKRRIAVARRMLHRHGLNSQIGGHVSLRAPQEQAFYVTPFQYFDECLPEHVSKVWFDLQVPTLSRQSIILAGFPESRRPTLTL